MDELGEQPAAEAGGTDWPTRILGIANFVVFAIFGAFLSWRTQQLENEVSIVQTASEYLEIIARNDAPGYAKGLALSAIYSESLLAKDLVVETAYRIEDETTSQGSIVGALFHEIAHEPSRLQLPLGFLDQVATRRDPVSGDFTLFLSGWGIDSQLGGLFDRKASDPIPAFQLQLDNDVYCTYPTLDDTDCHFELSRRPDVDKTFSNVPTSTDSGFAVTLPLGWDHAQQMLMKVRLISKEGAARVIYARCIELTDLVHGKRLVESPARNGRCVADE